MRDESAASVIQKLPPKPQHSSAREGSMKLRPFTAASSLRPGFSR
jgi:hypothetical protein